MKRAAWPLAAMVAANLGRPPTHAQAGRLPATVLVAEQSCLSARYEPKAFYRLLQVELRDLGVRTERLPEASEPGAQQALNEAVAVVAIECGATPDTLALRVSDTASGKELARNLSVADVGEDARPRALALAVVALIESSWDELVTGAPAASPAQSALPEDVRGALRARLFRRLGEAPSARPAAPPVEPPHSLRARSEAPFEVAIATRMFVAHTTALIGPQLGYAAKLGAKQFLRVDVEALWGQSDLSDALGTVGSMDLYWLTAGTELGWRTGSTPELRLGPGLTFGYAFADAHADRTGTLAHSQSHAVMSALLGASVRAPLSNALQAVIAAELGYTFVGVVFLGDQAHLSGMAGPSCALRVGLAW
jgi:hypothetical protein